MFSYYGFQIFLKIFVTLPVVPSAIGTSIHLKILIRFVSIHKLFISFSALFFVIFQSAGIAIYIRM